MRFFLRLLLGAVVGCGLGLLARRVFGSPSSAVSVQAAADEKPSPFSALAVDSSPEKSSESEEVYPVGYVTFRGRINVVMSDGTTRTERDSQLGVVERNSVMISGKKLFIRARQSSAKSDSFASEPPVAQPTASAQLAPEVGANEAQSSRQQGSWIVGPDGVARLRSNDSVLIR